MGDKSVKSEFVLWCSNLEKEIDKFLKLMRTVGAVFFISRKIEKSAAIMCIPYLFIIVILNVCDCSWGLTRRNIILFTTPRSVSEFPLFIPRPLVGMTSHSPLRVQSRPWANVDSSTRHETTTRHMRFEAWKYDKIIATKITMIHAFF